MIGAHLHCWRCLKPYADGAGATHGRGGEPTHTHVGDACEACDRAFAIESL